MVEVWGGRGDSSTPSGGLESDMDEGKGRKGRRERKKVDVFLVFGRGIERKLCPLLWEWKKEGRGKEVRDMRNLSLNLNIKL